MDYEQMTNEELEVENIKFGKERMALRNKQMEINAVLDKRAKGMKVKELQEKLRQTQQELETINPDRKDVTIDVPKPMQGTITGGN